MGTVSDNPRLGLSDTRGVDLPVGRIRVSSILINYPILQVRKTLRFSLLICRQTESENWGLGGVRSANIMLSSYLQRTTSRSNSVINPTRVGESN